jgi:hypothetical protein
MFGFIIGAIAGGVATYLWRDRIRHYVDSQVPTMRERAAERLGELGERATSALDRARTRIDTGVRTGQERLKTGTGGRADQGGTHRASASSGSDQESRPGGSWSGTTPGHPGGPSPKTGS